MHPTSSQQTTPTGNQTGNSSRGFFSRLLFGGTTPTGSQTGSTSSQPTTPTGSQTGNNSGQPTTPRPVSGNFFSYDIFGGQSLTPNVNQTGNSPSSQPTTPTGNQTGNSSRGFFSRLLFGGTTTPSVVPNQPIQSSTNTVTPNQFSVANPMMQTQTHQGQANGQNSPTPGFFSRFFLSSGTRTPTGNQTVNNSSNQSGQNSPTPGSTAATNCVPDLGIVSTVTSVGNAATTAGTIAGAAVIGAGTAVGTAASAAGKFAGATVATAGTIAGGAVTTAGTVALGAVTTAGIVAGGAVNTAAAVAGGAVATAVTVAGGAVATAGAVAGVTVSTAGTIAGAVAGATVATAGTIAGGAVTTAGTVALGGVTTAGIVAGGAVTTAAAVAGGAVATAVTVASGVVSTAGAVAGGAFRAAGAVGAMGAGLLDHRPDKPQSALEAGKSFMSYTSYEPYLQDFKYKKVSKEIQEDLSSILPEGRSEIIFRVKEGNVLGKENVSGHYFKIKSTENEDKTKPFIIEHFNSQGHLIKRNKIAFDEKNKISFNNSDFNDFDKIPKEKIAKLRDRVNDIVCLKNESSIEISDYQKKDGVFAALSLRAAKDDGFGKFKKTKVEPKVEQQTVVFDPEVKLDKSKESKDKEKSKSQDKQKTSSWTRFYDEKFENLNLQDVSKQSFIRSSFKDCDFGSSESGNQVIFIGCKLEKGCKLPTDKNGDLDLHQIRNKFINCTFSKELLSELGKKEAEFLSEIAVKPSSVAKKIDGKDFVAAKSLKSSVKDIFASA